VNEAYPSFRNDYPTGNFRNEVGRNNAYADKGVWKRGRTVYGPLKVSRKVQKARQQEGLFYKTRFESTDGFNTTVSGSGVVDFGWQKHYLDTGTTSGSTARIQDRYKLSPVHMAWDKVRVFSVYWWIIDDSTDMIAYTGTGDLAGGGQGFGLQVKNGDIRGYVNDGAAHTTTLYSNPGTGEWSFTVELIPGVEVVFKEGGSAIGSVSHDLTGDTDGQYILDHYIENTAGVQRRLGIQNYKFGLDDKAFYAY